MYEFYVKTNDDYKLIYQSTNHSTEYLWRYLYNNIVNSVELDSFFFKFDIESLRGIFFLILRWFKFKGNRMLEQDLKDLNSIKDELNSFNIPENDQDFIKLVTLKDIDPGLRENLILLHSNYKTELKDLKLFVYRTNYRIVDQTERIMIRVDKELQKNKNGVLSHGTRNIAIIFGIVLVAFMILFIFALINPDAFKTASEALKSFMPSIFGIDKEIIMQPAITQ